jgi:hypothetical protein
LDAGKCVRRLFLIRDNGGEGSQEGREVAEKWADERYVCSVKKAGFSNEFDMCE